VHQALVAGHSPGVVCGGHDHRAERDEDRAAPREGGGGQDPRAAECPVAAGPGGTRRDLQAELVLGDDDVPDGVRRRGRGEEAATGRDGGVGEHRGGSSGWMRSMWLD
jgi:hypothetical protein